ncbi:MAG: DUF3576 domain-containing protein [Alphaproteobacteria bacterium]|nr:DUF3576 domain-containing protein [Alphaproteobacteria bacterium]
MLGWTLGLLTALAIVAGCSGIPRQESEEYVNVRRGVSLPKSEHDKVTGGRLFGDEGLVLAGPRKAVDGGGGGGGGIGVNAYLWRASLDTVSFMPLLSADPFGGVIITEWYSPPDTPEERFKVTVYILDTRLRADGLRVALFRQQRQRQNGDWVDSQVTTDAPTNFENAILTRARELRIAAVPTARR